MKNLNQSKLSEIMELEDKLLKTAPVDYGIFFSHAIGMYELSQTFIQKIEDEGWLFSIFLAHLKKHQLLALFSAIRLHHVQTIMNLRQVLESGANAAYALGNSNPDDFVKVTDNGLLDTPEKLKKRRYKWLGENYPKGSQAIKSMKKVMQTSMHSNLVDAYRSVKFEREEKVSKLKTPYFDLQNKYQVKSDLWAIANITMGLMDLFYGINQKYGLVTFSKGFTQELQRLDTGNRKLKDSLMATPNFKRAEKVIQKRNEKTP